MCHTICKCLYCGEDFCFVCSKAHDYTNYCSNECEEKDRENDKD